MTWTETVLSHMYPWPIGVLVTASAVSFAFGAVGVWALVRVQRILAVVPATQERLDALSNSVTLLTDTTESCFKALAMQLQFIQAQSGAAAPRPRTPEAEPQIDGVARKSRQRSTAGQARRGDTLAARAAREDVAEAELALRVHLNERRGAAADGKGYGGAPLS